MAYQQSQSRGAKGTPTGASAPSAGLLCRLEYVVLIPLHKTSTLNTVLIERRQVSDITDKNILHIGSGRNVDFIIYKNSQPGNRSIDRGLACLIARSSRSST